MLDAHVSVPWYMLATRWLFSIRAIRVASMLAAMTLIFPGEYTLAKQLHFPHSVAWAFPIALDLYAMYAMHQGNKPGIFAAVAMMITCQAMSHLIEAGLIQVGLPVVIVGSAIAPIVYALVHVGTHLPKAAAPIHEQVVQQEPEPAERPGSVHEPEPATDPEAQEPEAMAEEQPAKRKRQWTKDEGMAEVAKLWNAGASKPAIQVHMGWTSPQRVNQVLRAAQRAGLVVA